MYQRRLNESLYLRMGECESDALDSWRNHYSPGMSVCDALALRAHKVETTLQRFPGGYFSVTVSIFRRGRKGGDVAWFRLQKSTNGDYIRGNRVWT